MDLLIRIKYSATCFLCLTTDFYWSEPLTFCNTIKWIIRYANYAKYHFKNIALRKINNNLGRLWLAYTELQFRAISTCYNWYLVRSFCFTRRSLKICYCGKPFIQPGDSRHFTQWYLAPLVLGKDHGHLLIKSPQHSFEPKVETACNES